MVRLLNVLFMLAVIAGAALVYNMKRDAELTAEHTALLQRQIDEERETISLLKAEWSLLNQPSRLQKLVERYNSYLQLEPLEVEQIAALEDLPAKPMNLDPFGNDASLGGYAGGSSNVIR
ncbi:hypothetical protein [Breoghania sp. L-A4]|uniref:cell division protein FtsL n=1 Tax=Breoghania sp. L-A4 TaxID=2304600 RepID=UPI000E35D7B4|nr:hypothetical protein [Breoghania sp. L-A4]AXS41336.1 hypothetical protein D1F64_16560 [Breoghania sp. L-A4]